MTDLRPFRFGVNLLDLDGGWLDQCRRAEELGYDVLLVPDHLGFTAPVPALVAAASVTQRPRLGTFVLNAAFSNPTVLARDVAALDSLTGGRFELGIGTGYAKDEFVTAGLQYGSGRERVEHLAATVERVQQLLADPEHKPATHQEHIPLLLGGNGDRMVRLAATTADIVGFTGAASDAVGNLSLEGPDQLEERVAFVRDAAGERFAELELNVLVQRVEISDEPHDDIAARLVAYGGTLHPAELAQLPTLLYGTAEQIAEELVAHRKRYGFSYVTVLEPSMDQFAKVIPHLRDA